VAEQFNVVLDDLANMAGTFDREATTYDRIKPQITPPIAASGDATLDSVLGAVMECLDVLHTKMAESISEHAGNLRGAHDTYQRHDIDAHGLFDDLMPD
jgi:hypothetical protein